MKFTACLPLPSALPDIRDTPPCILCLQQSCQKCCHTDTQILNKRRCRQHSVLVYICLGVYKPLANFCDYVTVYFCLQVLHVCSSLPAAAGPATVAECRSSPRGPDPPPPPPETHSSPGTRRATQTGSRSGSVALRYELYTIRTKIRKTTHERGQVQEKA